MIRPLRRRRAERQRRDVHVQHHLVPVARRPGILRTELLPAFGALPLDRIGPAAVDAWFDRYCRTAPGGANRTLDVLRQILGHAVRCGHLAGNPARGVTRNRRPRATRSCREPKSHACTRRWTLTAAGGPDRAASRRTSSACCC